MLYSKIYNFILHLYHLYLHIPHIPWLSCFFGLLGRRTVENYKLRHCKLDEVRTIKNGPVSIGTVIYVRTNEPLETQISRLCEDAAQIVVWAMQTRSVQTLVIYDSTGMLAYNGLELHHTITAALDRIPASLQRDLSTCFANQAAIAPCDFRVVFTDCSMFTSQLLDLFISFDGMSHGFPLSGLRGAVLFSAYGRGVVRAQKPQLLEYIMALNMYEGTAGVQSTA